MNDDDVKIYVPGSSETPELPDIESEDVRLYPNVL